MGTVSLVVDKVLPAKVRFIIYIIVATGIPVLATLGYISDGDAQNILTLAALILGFGGGALAVVNKPVPAAGNAVADVNGAGIIADPVVADPPVDANGD